MVLPAIGLIAILGIETLKTVKNCRMVREYINNEVFIIRLKEVSDLVWPYSFRYWLSIFTLLI